MNILLIILAIVIGIASLWCTILIDMFKDEIWKGIVGLLCGLYLLYYGLFEYDHENKWIIVLTALAGGAIASFLFSLAT